MDEGAVDEDLVGLPEAEAGGVELDRFTVLRPLLHPHPDSCVGTGTGTGVRRRERVRLMEPATGGGDERAGKRAELGLLRLLG